MLNKQDILFYLKKNKKLFRDKFSIVKIGIFGSYARDEQTRNSDIDILIIMSEKTEDIFSKRMAIKDLISEEFSCNVDVCHEKAIKPIFKEMILKDAIYV